MVIYPTYLIQQAVVPTLVFSTSLHDGRIPVLQFPVYVSCLVWQSSENMLYVMLTVHVDSGLVPCEDFLTHSGKNRRGQYLPKGPLQMTSH